MRLFITITSPRALRHPLLSGTYGAMWYTYEKLGRAEVGQEPTGTKEARLSA